MKKLALLLLALGATAVATLTAPPTAEAACRMVCCPDGGCRVCCGPCIICP